MMELQMNIDPDAYLVNTERLRITKLSDKFWKTVKSLENLTDLLLVNCDNVANSLSHIKELNSLEKLCLSGVELENKVSEMGFPRSITELQIKHVTCDTWQGFNGSPNIKKFKYLNLELTDLLIILPKLKGLDEVELEAYDDDELEMIVQILTDCPNLSKSKMRLFDLSEDSIRNLLRAAAQSSIKIEMELEDSLPLDKVAEIAEEVKANLCFIED
tara:strand:+ start:98 stop:745 length:648 start_codon:yes stop_codon:yes gene_type:complete